MAKSSDQDFLEIDPCELLVSDLCSDVGKRPIPASTLWHRKHGRPSMLDKARSQQYLNPPEEKALSDYLLRMADNDFSMPVKYVRTLACVIAEQRGKIMEYSAGRVEEKQPDHVRPPGKNWPQGFYKRHPELKAKKVKALDWARHDSSIYDKVCEWFALIGPELRAEDVLHENVYNMDETGVLLSTLKSLKVLVRKDDIRAYRGAGVKRTLITAVECVSADGRCLSPLIIWPASTHRSNWTTYSTPGWHFACTETGYTDSEVTLYWFKEVFDPLTRHRAGGRPRVLISDGFGTHESLEVLQFCFENNIRLCRLPSHTSHLLQPCDVGVFGPLKTAYREQVERLYRGGANTVGKQHFTALYSRARETSMKARNIRAGWSGAGLYPFSPDRVMQGLMRPKIDTTMYERSRHDSVNPPDSPTVHSDMLRTPIDAAELKVLRDKLERQMLSLSDLEKARLQKLANAAEHSFANCALLLDENKLLFEQNNEKKTRSSQKATIVGRAKVMSYEDIVAAQKHRHDRVRSRITSRPTEKVRVEGGEKRRASVSSLLPVNSTDQADRPQKKGRRGEFEKAQEEMDACGFGEYCAVLAF